MVNLWRSLRFLVVSVVLLGLIYPLIVTGIGQLVFPYQANGSMVKVNGRVVGSKLIAQAISNPGLFHYRPSAVNYAANGSGGSNLGPTNPALIKEIKGNIQTVEQQNPGTPVSQIPPDMVESSASGLDPDISIQNATLQVPRIAKSTGLSEQYLISLINRYKQGRLIGIWGAPMVNVMKLNLAIEQRLGK
ncbi:potassium-transporting ATPase subunit KdpC [Alicyclobacillus mengziensis]|uniref:Potassium-transporting ATPase KdpC subunit n=1 Tax=Alicyclobacillus mengziensis TaxID=2931921 RepID=A0A9X7Z5R2_9BACL|nr:potassium-transporting ATPase subunit KdpC [Alicyclobacillus mengziensis]QSO47164.1 potassium-transporting ATPase subunit KdpC [Alicyclobacillus mengziensis]